MFELKFLTPPEESHIRPVVGQIRINRFTESFNTSFFAWLPQDYMNQWESAIIQLLKKKKTTAVLITEITSPCKDDYYFCWTLYREGSIVFIQNNLIRLNRIKGKYDVNKLAEYSGPRETETVYGEKISEWNTNIKDFEEYLKKIPKLRKPYEDYYRKFMEALKRQV
jgi:hypothetical protein